MKNSTKIFRHFIKVFSIVSFILLNTILISRLEIAIILKDFKGNRILIQRGNGEIWILKAKTWCLWTWLYEKKAVYLIFGYTSSKLINDYGEVCDFWTEEQIK